MCIVPMRWLVDEFIVNKTSGCNPFCKVIAP